METTPSISGQHKEEEENKDDDWREEKRTELWSFQRHRRNFKGRCVRRGPPETSIEIFLWDCIQERLIEWQVPLALDTLKKLGPHNPIQRGFHKAMNCAIAQMDALLLDSESDEETTKIKPLFKKSLALSKVLLDVIRMHWLDGPDWTWPPPVDADQATNPKAWAVNLLIKCLAFCCPVIKDEDEDIITPLIIDLISTNAEKCPSVEDPDHQKQTTNSEGQNISVA